MPGVGIENEKKKHLIKVGKMLQLFNPWNHDGYFTMHLLILVTRSLVYTKQDSAENCPCHTIRAAKWGLLSVHSPLPVKRRRLGFLTVSIYLSAFQFSILFVSVMLQGIAFKYGRYVYYIITQDV